MALKPISVSQFNEYVSRILTTDPLLMNVSVEGEISGVNYHYSGHIYFSLVDQESKVDCAIWRSYAGDIPFKLTDGMKVIVKGGISVYKKRGSYSLSVRSVEKLGIGDLAKAFEEMKQKLNSEGLFDEAHKKELPYFPVNIAVVTASTGAAVKDILKVIKLRNSVVNVYIYPAAVQGDGAAYEIASQIDRINSTRDDIDLMIVGRGGGSQEDLWAFNEEVVARSIYASRIPVISAVGHEIDTSISDLVADVRAATPTQAAEIAVPDTEELSELIDSIRDEMTKDLTNAAVFRRMKMENLKEVLGSTLDLKMQDARHKAENLRNILESNDPRSIMKKGYSIVKDENGNIVMDEDTVDAGSRISVEMMKGKLTAEVLSKGGEK